MKKHITTKQKQKEVGGILEVNKEGVIHPGCMSGEI